MILTIKDIYYNADNTNILKGVSISVEEGDCISLVGSSGSGKSTLLKLCADLIPITKGDILYKNKSYKEYEPLSLRKKISYCIQMPYLFGETVYENLEFTYNIRKEAFDIKRVKELLYRFNLDESFLNKKVNAISGGEKQRIAIIRNLLYVPDIILLDESTSALDKENAKVVEEYIKELNNDGVTVLWVTHSMEQSKGIFNKRITMSEGKIINEERLK